MNNKEHISKLTGSLLERGQRPDGAYDEAYLAILVRHLHLLSQLSRPNLRIAVPVFSDAMRMLHHRQERINKQQLKRRDVIGALGLLKFHMEAVHHCDVKLNPLLTQFMGPPINETVALDYYEKSVIGEVMDIYKRKVVIDEDGMRHLYKEKASDGKHVMLPENFLVHRAKRLPWIRYAIENSKEVYRLAEESWVTYAYAMVMVVPTASGPINNYFLVIVRGKKNQPFRFVTAYYMEDDDDFLRRIEPFAPFLKSPETASEFQSSLT
ncbi:MAG: hypothetical protein HYT79_01660 [Elusimicrobia bacterium]|nr:hypothetical protein [Elusimicrobiota bacterium]